MTHETVEDFVRGFPLHEAYERRRHETVCGAFPSLSGAPHETTAALQTWACDTPQRFFDRDVFADASTYVGLIGSPQLDGALTREADEALALLRRANFASSEAKTPLYRDELRAYDLRERILPEFVRLSEHVFSPLLGLLLDADRVAKSVRSQVPARLTNRHEQAVSRLAPSLTSHYSRVVRNAITHGGIRISDSTVVFRDESGATEKRTISEAEGLADRMLDVCNGIAAAIALGHVGCQSRGCSLQWCRSQHLLGLTCAPFLWPRAFLDYGDAGRSRASIVGEHGHVAPIELLADIVRTLIIAKPHLPATTHLLVHVTGPRRALGFAGHAVSDIPDMNAPIKTLRTFANAVGAGSLAFIEHGSLLSELITRSDLLRNGTSWAIHHDTPYPLGKRGLIDFELRQLTDTSVSRRSRFSAIVVSRPTERDVDTSGRPTRAYLQSLFNSTAIRWAMRSGERPVGADRLKVFTSGTITVHASNARLTVLRNRGLDQEMLFRFEFPLGTPTNCAFLGGGMYRDGPFVVSINPDAEEFLRSVANGGAS